MIELLIAGAATAFGYVRSRKFVRQRLRFVDAIQKPIAPVVAGAAAALLAAPVVAILPVVGVATALIFGTGIGVGVHHGAKDARRLPGG